MIGASAVDIANRVRAGSITAVEVASEHLDRIHALDGSLNSFITVDDESAMQQAERVDLQIDKGIDPGRFAGVPFSVKDTYDTAGMRTTYGSRLYETHVPTSSFAPVERLTGAGGVLVGKTNTPEFAVFIRTVNDLKGECTNAWDGRRIAGGSSGGAAASVAAGLTPVALGSDGGGSVRIPAALNGVFGLIPTRGRLPRTAGGITTRNFSAAGPITRYPQDLSLMLDIMAGSVDYDPISSGICPPCLPTDRSRVTGIRWVESNGMIDCVPEIRSIVKAAAAKLATDLDLDFRDDGHALPSAEYTDVFYSMMKADRLASGGADLLASPRSDQLTRYARHQFTSATDVTGAQYSQGLEAQFHATSSMLSLLDHGSIIATPTVQITAPLIPQGTLPLPEEARAAFVANTFLMNFTGLPAVTIPCGQIDGMPVGLQLISVPDDEHRLISYAQKVCRQAPLAPTTALTKQGETL